MHYIFFLDVVIPFHIFFFTKCSKDKSDLNFPTQL